MPASILSVRVSAEERQLLEAAAEKSRTSLSDFVRRTALDAAEIECLERQTVAIAAKDWVKFEAWAQRPAAEIPALKVLARMRPTWQR